MSSVVDRMLLGGYPEVLQRGDEARRNAWFQSYVTTLLQHDIRELGAISSVLGMERLLRLCAARSSSIVNETAIASEIGLPRKTVSRYLDLLEQIFLIWRVPAYANERGRRVTKAPKAHLVDIGLAAYLYGADAYQLATNRSLPGGLLETFVINELRAQAGWSATRPNLFHYREYEGLEIDAVLERRNGDVAAIEIKATSTPGENDFRSMRKFREMCGTRFRRGVLLYGGAKQLTFGEDLVALPISAVWSQAARAQ